MNQGKKQTKQNINRKISKNHNSRFNHCHSFNKILYKNGFGFFFTPKLYGHNQKKTNPSPRSSINRLYKRISMQIAALVSLQVVRVNDKRSKKPRTKENRSNRWNIKDTRCERNILSNG